MLRVVTNLLRVSENADQRSCQAGVHFGIKEAGGEARVAQSSCAADPVNILVNTLRQVVVDHVLNSPRMENVNDQYGNILLSLDIQTTGGHSRGDQHRIPPGLEILQSFLSFRL